MKHYSEFKYDSTTADTYKVGKRGRDKDYIYECDDILTFDIEVTSAWLDETGKIWNYEAGKSEKFWNEKTALSLCYIWQFSYNNEVYYGRELVEFREVLKQLSSDTHFIVYVHNLAYEFQFLCNILTWKTAFARDSHKVMYCISDEFENIEFRCSYFLTRLSLKDWGDEMTSTVKKLDTLQYTSKIRTPRSVLSKEELAYCEHDCLVVFNGIKSYKDRYEHIKDIPLTQTGEVRRVVKDKVVQDKELQRRLTSLLPDARQYRILKQTFAGGYTHANFTMSNRVIRVAQGYHFDFASSYPHVMCSERFPSREFQACSLSHEDWDDFAYMVRIRVEELDAKTYNHYISASKCFYSNTDMFYDRAKAVENLELDNGRVISNLHVDRKARKVERVEFDIWLTEQDLDIIEKTYDIKYTVVECYKSRKQYLPRVIVDYILQLYADKTTLKQKESDADFDEVLFTKYMTSKKFINCIFGMSCTDIVMDDVEFNGVDWQKSELTIFDVDEKLEDMKEHNHNRTFMNFAWGVWITAYARHNLWNCILAGDNGKDNNKVIYCDTDSIFLREYIDYSDYNANCRVKLQKMCDYYDIDIARTEPCDKKGIKHPLGVFAEEARWTEFKTMGAKRYCVREEDEKLHLTISGINKSAVACLNDDIENFNEDLVFDKDHANVHKMMLKYINNQKEITWNAGEYDEYTSRDTFGINMRNTSYSMSITDEYLFLTSLQNVNSHLACMQ